MKLLVYFKYKKIEKPIVKVIDTKNQVVLAFINSNGEHITLHLRDDGSILRNHYNKNKPISIWDNERINIAKEIGYNNPEKHGKYYITAKLNKIDNIKGYHIAGRNIDIYEISEDEDKKRYKKMKKIIIDMPKNNLMIHLYLSTKDNPYIKTSPSFPTSLGNIFIEFDKLNSTVY